VKLESVNFDFHAGSVTWNLMGNNAPVYSGDVLNYKGKKYKWQVDVVYHEKGMTSSGSWYTFGAPSAEKARRYLRAFKNQLKEGNAVTEV
jgi:hypothetical protein